MAAKTVFTDDDFAKILAEYDLGDYLRSAPIAQGTVQTNYVVQTSHGRFVLRYYETRSRESVLFESDVLAFLSAQNYPSPAQISNKQGGYVGTYRDKPFVLFAFLAGEVEEHPNPRQWQQLVQKVAELHKLTEGFHSPYESYRWNYTSALCQQLAQAAAERIDTPDANAKYEWHKQELSLLDLPETLPTGVCHGDFHFSNVLFDGNKLVAVLDFDDANITYLSFDLVGLIESQAWPYDSGTLDLARAREVVQDYARHRALSLLEQQHLFDVYKLSILFDCVWYFARGSVDDFYEKRKIDFLNDLGRQRFIEELFPAQ